MGFLTNILGGLFGVPQDVNANLPAIPDQPESVIQDEIVSQKDKARQLQRIQNQRSSSVTRLQNNPIQEDSLIRILARGE